MGIEGSTQSLCRDRSKDHRDIFETTAQEAKLLAATDISNSQLFEPNDNKNKLRCSQHQSDRTRDRHLNSVGFPNFRTVPFICHRRAPKIVAVFDQLRVGMSRRWGIIA